MKGQNKLPLKLSEAHKMNENLKLNNPIEYYEALVERGGWSNVMLTNYRQHGQYNLRIYNEARQQAWEQEQARTEIRNLKFGIS